MKITETEIIHKYLRGLTFNNKSSLKLKDDIFYEKKMIYITIVTFLSSITNVLLIYLLIGSLGLLGVVFALICSQIVAYIVAFYFGNKFHKMPWLKK